MPKRDPAPPNRVYAGVRTADGCEVGFVDFSGRMGKLEPRLDLFNHSPSGFEWGYGGSGPAQLALALAADATGDDDLALEIHQYFKNEIVAGLPEECWQLEAGNIARFAQLLRRPTVLFDEGD